MRATLLIVDDEKHTREGLESALEDTYDIYTAADADEAFNLMEAEDFEVVLTDLRMAGTSGMKVIDYALARPNRPVTIMMTAYGSVETAVQAMKRGAYDFLTKPIHLEKLELLILRALKSRTVEAENKVLHERLDQRFSFDGIIGNSKALNDVLERVKLVAPSRATVLIEGETGTGKELIAQSIHQNSPRNRKPFLAVNCAALSSSLLESELFGHEKGAFTGANERRIGRFEAADGGSLFLDEIGEIEAPVQVKLLRFLESRSFERLGSNKPLEVDVRLIFATNRNLEKMVKEGKFREDLYFRLNVIPIQIPPLRERGDDILPLIEHYVKLYSTENAMPPPQFSPGAKQALQSYRWPGNIRELRNFCENIVVLRHGGEVSEYDLDQKFLEPSSSGSDLETGSFASFPRHSETGGASKALSREENEKRLLRNALHEAKGNRTKAAELMGISRRTLHRKLALWPELDVG